VHYFKIIIGVNENFEIMHMNVDDAIRFLSKQNIGDILCLGPNKGVRNEILNRLEECYPNKFNKNTVYSKIGDSSRSSNNLDNYAIFTTYDSSKGLERKICVLCEFNKRYWSFRSKVVNTSYDILKNIFCVAASRGKEKIIFVENNIEHLLSKDILLGNFSNNVNFSLFNISTMFDFKYKEDVEECFSQLMIKKINLYDDNEILINNIDGYIDLSPCIGIFQEAVYFNKYYIDEVIKNALINKKVQEKKVLDDRGFIDFNKIINDVEHFYIENYSNKSLEEKILLLTATETGQNRYINQVNIPFVTPEQEQMIKNRLNKLFTKYENVQVECKKDFVNPNTGNRLFEIIGYADVVKDDRVFELKFVNELSHEHFLQCASYIICLNKNEGILWNTRKNEMYGITIPKKIKFLNCITKTITKRQLNDT